MSPNPCISVAKNNENLMRGAFLEAFSLKMQGASDKFKSSISEAFLISPNPCLSVAFGLHLGCISVALGHLISSNPCIWVAFRLQKAASVS